PKRTEASRTLVSHSGVASNPYVARQYSSGGFSKVHIVPSSVPVSWTRSAVLSAASLGTRGPVGRPEGAGLGPSALRPAHPAPNNARVRTSSACTFRMRIMGLLHGGSVITAGPSATRAVAAATLGPSMSLTMREGGAVWLRPSSLP